MGAKREAAANDDRLQAFTAFRGTATCTIQTLLFTSDNMPIL